MPILTEDIKLLKSAVMADTPDGGGAMTGNVVADGQSNNLFPDTSELDRALGRVNIRQIYGVAHTSDTDTLLGAHSLITDAPDDPLVHCTLMKAPAWGATRDQYREAIERYLVKGPRVAARLYETHYAGSLQVRLYSFVPTTFPAGGEAIVLRNPDGQEQYVRILRVAESVQQIAVVENNTTLVLSAYVAVCDIGQALEYDFIGPGANRVISESAYAQVYSTTVSGGAQFCGIKPLSVAGAPGNYSVTTTGGIYAPLVPAATVESPITDQFPLTERAALVKTGYASAALPAVSMVVGPNAVLTAPTPIEPGSVALQAGGTAFTDDAQGALKQGTLVVGSVDYMAGTITFLPGAPSYGTVSTVLTYKPATLAGASAFSAAFAITLGNQGLSFTNVFEPPPAPGSFTLSYMAQGRWYTLQDNLNGKLAGADSSYGIGTLNYATGSMAVTLGAIPDVGSPLVAQWGDPSAATAVSTALPAKLSTRLALAAQTKAGEISLAWSRGAANYTAATDAAGVLSGDATGQFANGVLVFAPTVFPDGNVVMNGKVAGAQTSVTGSGPYTLNGGSLPILPGTVRATTAATFPAIARHPVSSFNLWDSGGTMWLSYQSSGPALTAAYAVGTINYATGVVTMNANVSITMVADVLNVASGWQIGGYIGPDVSAQTVTLTGFTGVSYAAGTESASAATLTPTAWQLDLDTLRDPLLQSGGLLKIGADLYSYAAGVLRRGWNPATGAPLAANAGTVASDGKITVTSLPSNFTNGATWYNAAADSAAKQITAGVFRTASAPLKTGVLQLQFGAAVGSGNDAGVITGGGFTGTVDYQRGVVNWASSAYVDPAGLSYNAVFLQYLPLDATLLGLETARLPLDGKVPIYRAGGVVVVHNTQTLALPNPLVKGTVYSLGRARVASVRVKTSIGATVDGALYTTALDAGTITFPTGSDLTGLGQPFSVEHRIEDMMLTSAADISGKLSFTRSLTHDFPANTSYASGALLAGDVFARVHNVFDQTTWTGAWSDALIGSDTLASYNTIDYPITTTNRGAVSERWAIIFTSNTAFRIVGEKYGQVGTGDVNTLTEPNNSATATPFFSIPVTGWGGGWAVGNVLRLNTDACGSAIGVVRTVLQGPDTLASDKFTLAFRGDVNA